VNIGTEKPAIVVEPIEDPFRPAPPEPDREESPGPAPEREPERVPA
jgi:hypothetical protein